MKRSIARADLCRTPVDRSPRTLKEIRDGAPKKKPVPYQPGLRGDKPDLSRFTMPSTRDLELAKQQAAKFLPKNKRQDSGAPSS